MIMEPLVSIIIPIYNVEKYISKTVDSVLNQTYRNIEIILVDDGSPDNCPHLIDSMSKEDSRIKVVHKPNGGVSSARNAGIDKAQGKYISFVDGDDWIDPDYVQYFVNLIEKYNCDLVYNINNYSQYNTKSRERESVISSEKAIEWIYLGKIFVAVWNKMYRTSFLRENNIRFDESIWYGEGMLFNVDCLQFTDQVAVGEKCVYHQTPNPDSAMRKFNLESNHCGIRSLDIQKQHWKKKNRRIKNAWAYHRRAFNWSIMSGLARTNQDEKYKDEFRICANNLKKNLWTSLKVSIPIKEKIKYVCLAINPYIMAKREKYKNK